MLDHCELDPYFSENQIKIQNVSFTKMHFKMSSAKMGWMSLMCLHTPEWLAYISSEMHCVFNCDVIIKTWARHRVLWWSSVLPLWDKFVVYKDDIFNALTSFLSVITWMWYWCWITWNFPKSIYDAKITPVNATIVSLSNPNIMLDIYLWCKHNTIFY